MKIRPQRGQVLLLSLFLMQFTYTSNRGVNLPLQEISDADIQVFAPQITPAPLAPPEEGGTGAFCFFVSNSSGSYSENLLTLEIELSGVIAAEGVTNISTTGNVGVSAWEWMYDESTATITGLQSNPISSDYWEEVCIDVTVTETSTSSNKNNGFHAMILFDEDACNISAQNDEIEIYTHTEASPCPNKLILSNTIDPGEFKAAQEIISDGMVTPTNDVIFNSGGTTVLDPGFMVIENAVFEVKLEGCVN